MVFDVILHVTNACRPSGRAAAAEGGILKVFVFVHDPSGGCGEAAAENLLPLYAKVVVKRMLSTIQSRARACFNQRFYGRTVCKHTRCSFTHRV